jgi:hypothetical protein
MNASRGWPLSADNLQVEIIDRGPYADDAEAKTRPKPAARFAHSAVVLPSTGESISGKVSISSSSHLKSMVEPNNDT